MREAVRIRLNDASQYDHPIYFLQHMVWHDGYHFSSLMQCLRNGGAGRMKSGKNSTSGRIGIELKSKP
ncbi:MAG: hypothetical protein R2688_03510 [Fimbriimonadaceae bacterium]